MAGLKYLHENEPNTIFGTLRYIFSTLEHRSETASATLEEMLTHEDQIARRFGAAMAVRPHLFIDPAFVAITAVTADPEVKEIVRHAIKMPLPPGTIWEGNNPFEG